MVAVANELPRPRKLRHASQIDDSVRPVVGGVRRGQFGGNEEVHCALISRPFPPVRGGADNEVRPAVPIHVRGCQTASGLPALIFADELPGVLSGSHVGQMNGLIGAAVGMVLAMVTLLRLVDKLEGNR